MVCPALRLCMDNGIMVAWTGMQRLRLGLGERPLGADAKPEMLEMFVEVRPRWPIGPRDERSTTQQQQLSKRKRAPSLTTSTGTSGSGSGSGVVNNDAAVHPAGGAGADAHQGDGSAGGK